MKRKVFPDVSLNEEKWSMDNNMDMLVNIFERGWETLDDEEKVDLAQLVANIECRYLGLPPIWVKSTSNDDVHVISSYCDEPIPLIALNAQIFNEKTGERMLNAVLHECRHCYQHRLIELYDTLPEEYKCLHVFCEVPAYKEEFENYKKVATVTELNDIDAILSYATQLVEIDARLYANLSEKEYLARVERYMRGQDAE